MLNTSFYDNIRSYQPKESCIWDLPDIIKSNKFKDIINDVKLGNKQKDELPIFTPCAEMFEGKKTAKNISMLNGIIYFDIDKKDNDVNLIQSIPELKNDPYIFMLYKSASGQGLRIFFFSNLTNNDDYLNYWSLLAAYLKTKYNIIADKKCKSPVTKSFISHDPDIHYNPKCIVINIKNDNVYQNTGDNTSRRIDELYNILSGDNTSIENSKQTKEVTTLQEGLSNTLSGDNTSIEIEKKSSFYINKSTQYNHTYDAHGFAYYPDGLPYCDAYIKHDEVFDEGKRNNRLTVITTKLIFNNPDIKLNQLVTTLQGVNIKHCSPPMTSDDVNKLVTYLYYNKKDLDYSKVIKLKYLFESNDNVYSLTEDEENLVNNEPSNIERNSLIKKIIRIKKQCNRTKKFHQYKANITLENIHDAILLLSGDNTSRSTNQWYNDIANHINKSKRTIIRYFNKHPELYSLITE